MFLLNLFVLVLWTKVASALEGLSSLENEKNWIAQKVLWGYSSTFQQMFIRFPIHIIIIIIIIIDI